MFGKSGRSSRPVYFLGIKKTWENRKYDWIGIRTFFSGV